MQTLEEATRLYASDMTRRELMGIQAARDGFRDRIDKALIDDVHTVVQRHNRPVALIVSVKWARRAAEALGETFEFVEPEPDQPIQPPLA